MAEPYSKPDSPDEGSQANLASNSETPLELNKDNSYKNQEESAFSKKSSEQNPLEDQKMSSENESESKLNEEWQSLRSKVRGWLGSDSHSNQIDLSFSPLVWAFGLFLFVFLLKAYITILTSIERFPFASSFFEIVGAFWLIQFSFKKLIRQQDRENFVVQVQKQWKTFFESKPKSF